MDFHFFLEHPWAQVIRYERDYQGVISSAGTGDNLSLYELRMCFNLLQGKGIPLRPADLHGPHKPLWISDPGGGIDNAEIEERGGRLDLFFQYADYREFNEGLFRAVCFKPYLSAERFPDTGGNTNLQTVTLCLIDGGKFVGNGIIEG